MTPPRDNTSSTDDTASSQPAGLGRTPPLVIVSERGRHSEASRRIVRAQAARASAAQSRETRARNREDRHKEGPLSPGESSSFQTLQVPPNPNPNTHTQNVQSPPPPPPQRQPSAQNQVQDRSNDDQEGTSINALKPLLNWITNVLHLSAASFAAGAVMLAGTGMPQLGNANNVLSAAGGMISDNGDKMEGVDINNGGIFNRRLPVALPRGFVALQGRIQISDPFMVLLSRTACIDFSSPGAESRLHELLFDIVMTSATANMRNSDQPGHPIQRHLRIACTCLTIFQGQRADGQTFAFDQKYNSGLEAAWAEVIALDQDALKEPKSAEAALWAIFIISVTCGSTVAFFQQLLWGLMHDLQLQYWEQVRKVLIDFIYPGSFLDAPCKRFYESLKGGQLGQMGPLLVA
ncbi:hypothetical protein CLAFUW4_02210 [Fulvia fulva]|uniref:Uncharacterized protein n=1 Tax=Passalora fulva TaxID=5499 RepID=A0A9Q8L7T2_PASFU|nr:uncharacterized protein CLAFUR5_02200 [Fulvia fulva]KAK4634438.1 hypothetical protein CLAFUR4_02205 [Fulvia fulva]KAK4636502.1 hypothetical protein CLAFUR0_02208 [Fulvia fulva]UJO12309.1 hypothetical protein CLAFUR5_02200 [Fulvia fulva]WPV09564.1 hypothetical protein CLAFUW4_02210 [Fulvia fulva]WPV24957.1 hypothetical protein CLAFUW7_02210 [Fulvia fulva]